MNKRVLIIANDDPDIGSDKDKESYHRFFTSLEGGAWLDSEIIELCAPSVQELDKCISTNGLCNMDYLIVVFSGHGSYKWGVGKTLLSMKGDREDMNFCVYDDAICRIAKKQLTILDACRCSGQVSSMGMLKEACMNCNTANIYGLCRAAYEDQIENVPDGSLVLYACEKGMETHGEKGVGGDFSLALKNGIMIGLMANDSKSFYLPIADALDAVKCFPRTKCSQIEGDDALGGLPWILNRKISDALTSRLICE